MQRFHVDRIAGVSVSLRFDIIIYAFLFFVDVVIVDASKTDHSHPVNGTFHVIPDASKMFYQT